MRPWLPALAMGPRVRKKGLELPPHERTSPFSNSFEVLLLIPGGHMNPEMPQLGIEDL
jgi:hypothetical protein